MVTSLGLDSRVRSLRRVLPLPAPSPPALQSLSPSGWRLCLPELGKLMLAQIWISRSSWLCLRKNYVPVHMRFSLMLRKIIVKETAGLQRVVRVQSGSSASPWLHGPLLGTQDPGCLIEGKEERGRRTRAEKPGTWDGRKCRLRVSPAAG